MMSVMANIDDQDLSTSEMKFARARARVLSREDRELKAALIGIRREKGLSQKDIADRLGVTQQSIHKLERYDSDPKASTLRRYANAVGALVEHQVQADIGQSVHMAARSRWVTGSSSGSRLIEIGDGAPTHAARSGWKASDPADFGLAT